MANDRNVAYIRELLNECVEEARSRGFEGGFQDYEFTETDHEYVIEKLGYKPTEDEWKAAGLDWIDEEYVKD